MNHFTTLMIVLFGMALAIVIVEYKQAQLERREAAAQIGPLAP